MIYLREEKTKDLIQFINKIEDIELMNTIKDKIQFHCIQKDEIDLLGYILSNIEKK